MNRIKAWLSVKTNVTRLELWAMCLMIAVTVAIGLALVNEWNNQAQSAANKAEAAVTLQTLRNEKVCSDTNQGQACRDLFTRLVNNVSPDQKRQLACLIARDLHRPDLASNIDCTDIIRPR